MKSSTKKILLASLLTGTLVGCTNTTFAADLPEELEGTTLSDNTIEIGEGYVELNGISGTYGNGYWEAAGRSGTYNWEGDNTFRISGANTDGKTVSYNFITINGGKYTLIFDGNNTAGNLIGNRIVFDNVNMTFGMDGNGPSYSGTISDNLFRINGGTFSNFYSYQSGITATNNTVEIDGGADVSNAYLFGGILGEAGTASGNTLNVNGVGYKARNIYDFDTLNFNLPASTKNGDTALTLTESADVSGKNINAVIAGGTDLTTGDKITLLASGRALEASDASLSSRFAEGVTLTYDTEMSTTNNGVELTLGSARVEEQTRALNQGALVSSGEIGRSTERIIDILRVEDFEPGAEEESDGSANMMMISNSWGIFFDGGSGKIKTKTGHGSYVESRERGFNMGFARTLPDPNGASFVIAPVFDYGKNSYDSYLSDGTHGHGDSKHFLGGIFFRKMNKNGFYWEGSFRGGKSDINFTSNDFVAGGRRMSVGYDDSTPAFAGHVRLGKLKRLDRNNLMHIYGVYHHSHVNGLNTTISTGERYNFDSVDNGTFMIGYRLTTRTSKISSIYTGLAFQYQFNGSTSATYRGHTTPKAETKGSTGILELGWQIKPKKSNPWTLDLNFTGRIGLQKGISASAGVKKTF